MSEPAQKLCVVPRSLSEANDFVRQHHRHHGPVRGAKFAVGASIGPRLVGVAIVGRPVARMLQDGVTLEVVRVATDGTANACSLLYGAAWRATRELGYHPLITYTLAREPGTSLRASGFHPVALTRAESWSRPSRPRTDAQPPERKVRWQKER